MQLTDIAFDGLTPIDGYGPGFFRVGGKVLHGPVLVTVTSARSWGGYEDIASLVALVEEIDVLFIGTGKAIAHPPAALRTALEEAGIGVEAMATDAAARTYNVLLSEGRRIAAALLPVE
ncbi:Mth938-like domain-containing protein [Defluviimonas aestuarii]|uniref:Mth938-like domain-containing protein n=1 Tax=Albidovulum aestuarii TaxID=1130726 RepID=UPI00249B422B|nr:Mth938-like domain-containing protein [Defluviimonas aestuarii]MDI3337388.1 Mth938-like domain-containing protein [Defluviimonas aestuarii]